MSQQPSGWYDDPSNPQMLRYWDGVTWTNHTAPKQSPTLSQPREDRSQQPPVPHVPQPTTPMPQGWQGQDAPQQAHYPGQYPHYPQPPQATGPAGWMTTGPSTADGVPLASWGKRLLAWILDGIIISVVSNVLTPMVIPGYDATGRRITDELTRALEASDDAAVRAAVTELASVALQAGLVTFLIASVYAIAFWTTTAQTPGKMAVGISVRHTDRPGPLTVGTAIRRRILALVAIVVPFLSLIDGLWPLWDSRRQALHDKVASTQVVVGKQPRRQA